MGLRPGVLLSIFGRIYNSHNNDGGQPYRRQRFTPGNAGQANNTPTRLLRDSMSRGRTTLLSVGGRSIRSTTSTEQEEQDEREGCVSSPAPSSVVDAVGATEDALPAYLLRTIRR
jgi:hypothetical protein